MLKLYTELLAEANTRYEFNLQVVAGERDHKLTLELKTSTDEVDDLDPVAVLKHGGAPIIATHDGEVQFDSNSSRRQIKLGD